LKFPTLPPRRATSNALGHHSRVATQRPFESD
jgi:hypothetical protein